MAGIDNNTILYLRGDSFEDLSLSPKTITNSGVTIIDDIRKCLNVYGTSQILNITHSFKFDGDFTVESFVKLDEFSTGFQEYILNGQSTNKEYLFGIDNASNKVNFRNHSSGLVLSATNTFPLNKFVHVAFVRKDGLLKIFLDGKLNNSVSFDVAFTLTSPKIENSKSNITSTVNFYNYRISNVARYTENFTPPTQLYNSITINKTNQTNTNIEFNIEKLGRETINKVEVLVNGTVSETYTDSYDNIDYLIDTELCSIGNNKIIIRVTYDDLYTEELLLTHNITVDELPLETPLIDTVERVKLLTKSKQNEKNMLSSILTSKNVEISEEDKMSDLIGKVDLLGEYDNPILWLYKDGIENVVFEILGSGLTIDKFHFTGSGAYASKKVSTNTIDLTSYKTLKVEYGNCTTTKGTSYYPVIGFGVATTKQTGDNHLTSKTANSSSSQFSNSNSISSLDISNINGLYYIDIYVNSYAGATLDININKIWLEK